MKQETSKHTATPWTLKYWENKKLTALYSIGANGNRICDLNKSVWNGNEEEARANAEFIVRACNAHDEMVDFIKKLYNAENADIFNQIFTFAGDIISKAEGNQ